MTDQGITAALAFVLTVVLSEVSLQRVHDERASLALRGVVVLDCKEVVEAIEDRTDKVHLLRFSTGHSLWGFVVSFEEYTRFRVEIPAFTYKSVFCFCDVKSVAFFFKEKHKEASLDPILSGVLKTVGVAAATNLCDFFFDPKLSCTPIANHLIEDGKE